MNKAQEKLVAQYLAGEDVGQAIIQACKDDPSLLKTLSQEVAFARLLNFSLQAQTEESFNLKLAQALKKKPSLSWFDKLAARFNFDSRLLLKPVLMYTVAFAFVGGIWLAQPKSVGVVYNVIEAKTNSGDLFAGNTIKAGQFDLIEGYAEIKLENGVTLVLEAPIQLKVKNPDHVILSEGNLIARVPQQAIGFKIDTPSSEIVDLGTEFAVKVNKTGKSEVHVLEGEVKARASKDHNFEHLTVNQARAYSLSQQVRVIESQPDVFMRALPGHSVENPDYLHWSFDEKLDNAYACSGPGINDLCYPAYAKSLASPQPEQAFGPEQVSGKFNQALYFNGENTWLDTEFSGIEGSNPRTVAFWLKLPADFSVDKGFGILSWGLSEKLSAWQISPNPNPDLAPLGSMRIGTNHGVVIGTQPLNDEKWHHVSIVLFGGEQADLSTHVLIYIDGKLEKTANKSIGKVDTETNHPKSRPLSIGRNLAFTNPNNKLQTKRFFQGWLDEIYVFDTALNKQQILRLMQNNKVDKN